MVAKKYIWSFLLLGLAFFAQAQEVLFTAQADKYTVAVGETFRVTFTINASASDIGAPNFSGFRVVSGPMYSHSSSFINGVSTTEKAVSYDLIPLKTGTYTIEAASTKVGGKAYQTKPMEITVVEASQRKKGTLEEKAEELVSVEILTNKRKVYVGEPVSARYTLVLRANIGNYETLEQPDFQGFVKNDIELTRIQTQREKINGKTETTADIAKFVLIPQQTGTFSPGQLQLRIPTQVPTGRRDWFGQPEVRNVNQISSSKFPTIDILPLPVKGKPANFNGGVGKFKFNVDISRKEVKGNESITLTVEVSGNGNIQLIDVPEPQIPSSIESYDPKYKENFSVSTAGVKGFKRNEYLLIPRYKGIYKIPAMQFSYFDPDKETYEVIKSEPIEIEVTEGEEPTNAPSTSTPGNTDKNAVSAIGEDILFIHTQPTEFKKETESFFVSTLHKVLALCIVLLTFILFLYNRIKSTYKPNVEAKTRKRAGTVAKKQLKQANVKLQANDIKAFYGELSTALQHYFNDKAGLAQSDFNLENILSLINKKGGNDQLSKDVRHLLNQANMARFAPLTTTNMKDDYALALSTIERLEDLL